MTASPRRWGLPRVRWAHLPPPIKAAIRRAGFRPVAKQCYANCQKLVLLGELDGAEYWEGIARTCGPHAWIVYQGQPVDITLPDPLDVMAGWPVSREELAVVIPRRGYYGPIHEGRMREVMRAHHAAKAAHAPG